MTELTLNEVELNADALDRLLILLEDQKEDICPLLRIALTNASDWVRYDRMWIDKEAVVTIRITHHETDAEKDSQSSKEVLEPRPERSGPGQQGMDPQQALTEGDSTINALRKRNRPSLHALRGKQTL